MRTSEEVYHRIRWDPRFDAARFVVGITMRGAEPKRMPLPSFVPGGDIPWHRIVFFEADGELVWDRSTGRDVIDSSRAGRTRDARRLREPFFTARTPFAWDPLTGWRPLEGPPAQATRAGLRVLTWNTLWDRYDGDRIDTDRRRPLLLEALRRADADVIALQEVEAGLLAMLLRAPWVRSGYTLSTGPSGRDITEYGLLLLSRLPVLEAGRHVLGRHKAVEAVTVQTAGGPVVVAVTHLTSDHSEGGAVRREGELARLAEVLAGVDGDMVVLGDFNDGGNGPVRALDMRDAWTEVHGPGDTTVTFDPRANPLAAVSSLSGRASRLDRVLLRGPRAAGAALLGDSPATPDGLFVSDHYGVVVDIAPGEGEGDPSGVLDARPTARTAVAWIPPAELWPAIQEIRERYDPRVRRWPPHVNVLFGFVPESGFEQAAPLLSSAAAAIAPFTVRLEGVHTFTHRDDCTVWLDPTAAGWEPWEALHDALERAFPHCKGRAEGYTPHLTLARTRHPERLVAECQARLGGMSAHVGELVLLSRRGEEPMRPRATVALGTGEIHWLDDEPAFPGAVPYGSAARPAGRSQAGTPHVAASDAARVVDQLRAVLPEGVVHVAGSRRLGCELPGADLDLVVALPGEVGTAAVEARVREALPQAAGLRRVIGARAPGLRLRAGDLGVDLVVVATGGVPPDEAVRRRAELDEAAAIALSAVSDADAVLDAVGERRPAFLGLARQVKAWARARGLDSAPFGGLPGVAWAVLAARTVREADPPPGDLLRHFFGHWAAWDWRDPIALGPGEESCAEAPVRVLTPSAPVRLCSEQVGAGMRDLLTQELYTAWETLESAPETGVLSPPPMHRRHAAWAVVTVRSENLDTAVGRVRGRMRSLLTALEEAGAHDAHAWPRPFVTGSGLARFAIGLGQSALDAGTISEVAGSWTAGLRGVDLAWKEGGHVPTLLPEDLAR